MEDKEYEKIIETSKEIIRDSVKDLFGDESLAKVEKAFEEITFDIDYDLLTAKRCSGYCRSNEIFLTSKHFRERKNSIRVVGTMIHEIAHAFSNIISKDKVNDVIEEATANLFAETCINYYIEKNGKIPYISQEENEKISQQPFRIKGYEKEGEFLSTIIYALQKQGRTFDAINEYLFGSKEQYVSICKEVLGEDFSQVLKTLRKTIINMKEDNTQQYFPKAEEAMIRLLIRNLDGPIDELDSNIRGNTWTYISEFENGLRATPEGRLLYAIRNSEILREVHRAKLLQEKYDMKNMTAEEYVSICTNEGLSLRKMELSFKYIFEEQPIETFIKAFGDYIIKNHLLKDNKKLEDLTDEDITRFLMISHDIVREMYTKNGYKQSDYVKSLISSWYEITKDDLNKFKEITMVTGTIPIEQLEQIIEDNNLAEDMNATKLIELIQEYNVNTKDQKVLDELIKYYDDSEKENRITQITYGERYEKTELSVLDYIMNTYKNLDSINATNDFQTLIDMYNEPNKDETTKFILSNIDYNSFTEKIEQLKEQKYFDSSIPENQKAIEDIRKGDFSDINLKFYGLFIDSNSEFLANYFINQMYKNLEEAEEIDALMQFIIETRIDSLYDKIDEGFNIIDIDRVDRLKKLYETKLKKQLDQAKQMHDSDSAQQSDSIEESTLEQQNESDTTKREKSLMEKLGEQTLLEQEDTELKIETEVAMEEQERELQDTTKEIYDVERQEE